MIIATLKKKKKKNTYYNPNLLQWFVLNLLFHSLILLYNIMHGKF